MPSLPSIRGQDLVQSGEGVAAAVNVLRHNRIAHLVSPLESRPADELPRKPQRLALLGREAEAGDLGEQGGYGLAGGGDELGVRMTDADELLAVAAEHLRRVLAIQLGQLSHHTGPTLVAN